MVIDEMVAISSITLSSLLPIRLIQFVPIPPCEFCCTRGHDCCRRRYVPLGLAYARTIHKFQGLSAGPVDEGKIKNMYDVIVCDPDERQHEGKQTGLFYTALSRATTLGDSTGRGSAIYFVGDAFNRDRVKLLTRRSNMFEFENVMNRRTWVAYLQRNAVTPPATMYDGTGTLLDKYQRVFDWTICTLISFSHLCSRIGEYKRKRFTRSMNRDFAML